MVVPGINIGINDEDCKSVFSDSRAAMPDLQSVREGGVHVTYRRAFVRQAETVKQEEERAKAASGGVLGYMVSCTLRKPGECFSPRYKPTEGEIQPADRPTAAVRLDPEAVQKQQAKQLDKDMQRATTKQRNLVAVKKASQSLYSDGALFGQKKPSEEIAAAEAELQAAGRELQPLPTKSFQLKPSVLQQQRQKEKEGELKDVLGRVGRRTDENTYIQQSPNVQLPEAEAAVVPLSPPVGVLAKPAVATVTVPVDLPVEKGLIKQREIVAITKVMDQVGMGDSTDMPLQQQTQDQESQPTPTSNISATSTLGSGVGVLTGALTAPVAAAQGGLQVASEGLDSVLGLVNLGFRQRAAVSEVVGQMEAVEQADKKEGKAELAADQPAPDLHKSVLFTKLCLHRLNATRKNDTAAVERLDADIWRFFGQKGSILALNVALVRSGGGLIGVKDVGLELWAVPSIVAQLLEYTKPIFIQYGADVLMVEGSVVIITFPSATDACLAANTLMLAAEAFNKEVLPSVAIAKQASIQSVAVATAIADGLFLRLPNQAFGEVVNVLYAMLAKADKWAMLATEAVWQRVKKDADGNMLNVEIYVSSRIKLKHSTTTHTVCLLSRDASRRAVGLLAAAQEERSQLQDEPMFLTDFQGFHALCCEVAMSPPLQAAHQLENSGTMMVVALVGFHHLTAQAGIAHACGLLAKFGQVLHPVVDAYGGKPLQRSAPGCFVVMFGSVEEAFTAGMKLLNTVQNLRTSDPIDIAIALNTGRFIVAAQQAIGPTAQLTSCIATATSTGEMWLSGSSWLTLHQTKQYKGLPGSLVGNKLNVVGRVEQVECYRPLCSFGV